MSNTSLLVRAGLYAVTMDSGEETDCKTIDEAESFYSGGDFSHTEATELYDRLKKEVEKTNPA